MFVVLYICQVSEYLIITTVHRRKPPFKDHFIMFITKRNPIMTSTGCTKHFKRN